MDPFADLPVGLDHTTEILTEAILVKNSLLGIGRAQIPQPAGVRTDLIGHHQLPGGVAAEIELGAWSVPDGFRQLVEWGDVPDTESFRTWNMGIGLIAVIDATDVDAAAAAGHRVIGRLVASDTGDVTLVGDWR